MTVYAGPAQGNVVDRARPGTPADVPAFKFGDRVRPSDRNNVGTVVGVLGNGRYKVEFVGKEATAEKEFAAADLKLDDGRPAELDGSLPPPPPAPRPPWVPFPLDCLPAVPRKFVEAVAAALGCDPAMIAVPLLAAAAGAIGNSRVVRIKGGWNEPSILWVVIIALPGGMKSPALQFAFAPLAERQARLIEECAAAWAAWAAEKEAAKAEKRDPDPRLRPRLVHILIDDATTEAVTARLADNPRGLVCQPDELAKWIGSFDKYRGGKGGGDRQFWLSAHDGRWSKTDRRGEDRPVIYIPRASVSLAGGVQPAVWRRDVCNAAADEDGLASRLLHAMPEDAGGGWTNAEVGENEIGPYRDLLMSLLALDLDGGQPVELTLTDDARARFAALKTEVQAERSLAEEWEQAVLAKLDKHAARLALVFQLLDNPAATQVSDRWMEAGIKAARWFHQESHRVRHVLGADPTESRLNRLERVADENGGRLAPRDLIHRNRLRYPDAATAEAALNELVTRRSATWHWAVARAGPAGGRPSRYIERIPVAPPPADASPDARTKTTITHAEVVEPTPDGGSGGFGARSQAAENEPTGGDGPDRVIPSESPETPADAGGTAWRMRI